MNGARHIPQNIHKAYVYLHLAAKLDHPSARGQLGYALAQKLNSGGEWM
jgi:hypothetical protein